MVLLKFRVSVVILNHIESLPLAKLVRRVSKDAILVLNADNVDQLLAKQAIENGGPTRQLVRREIVAKRWESTLWPGVDAVFVCSQVDSTIFRAMNDKRLLRFVIPNGADTMAKRFDFASDKRRHLRILFCGSLEYLPNMDGILWFYREVFGGLRTLYPELSLRIVGKRASSPERFSELEVDPSVELLGYVDDLEPHYNCSSICVVPLRMGSGTRLKILEAMAFGVPIVSTSIGCEGLSLSPNTHLLVADDAATFINSVATLLNDSHLYEKIRVASRTMVEKQFDWSVIGLKMKAAIATLTGIDS